MDFSEEGKQALQGILASDNSSFTRIFFLFEVIKILRFGKVARGRG